MTGMSATIRALTSDVQGTCADFCRPMQRMGEAVNKAKGLNLDWRTLSAEWRALYRIVLDDVIADRRPWLRVDRIGAPLPTRRPTASLPPSLPQLTLGAIT